MYPYIFTNHQLEADPKEFRHPRSKGSDNHNLTITLLNLLVGQDILGSQTSSLVRSKKRSIWNRHKVGAIWTQSLAFWKLTRYVVICVPRPRMDQDEKE